MTGASSAVKYTQPDPSDTAGIRPRAAERAAREAAVLQAMPDDHGYLYAAGRTEHGTWLDFGGTGPLAHLLTEMLAQRPVDRPPIAEVRERLVWLTERT